MVNVVAIVSADAEWLALRQVLDVSPVGFTPFGEFISVPMTIGGTELSLVYVQGGWGKISAAASGAARHRPMEPTYRSQRRNSWRDCGPGGGWRDRSG